MSDIHLACEIQKLETLYQEQRGTICWVGSMLDTSLRRIPLLRMAPWFSATKNDPTGVQVRQAHLTTPLGGSCQCTRSTLTRGTWRSGHSFQQGTRDGIMGILHDVIKEMYLKLTNEVLAEVELIMQKWESLTRCGQLYGS